MYLIFYKGNGFFQSVGSLNSNFTSVKYSQNLKLIEKTLKSGSKFLVQQAGQISEKYSQKLLIRTQFGKLEKSAEIFRNLKKKLLVGFNAELAKVSDFRQVPILGVQISDILLLYV